MIKIEKRGFGYKIVFGGILKIADVLKYENELMENITKTEETFSIYHDMRSIRYFAKDAQIKMFDIRMNLKSKGIIRSSIVFNRPGEEKNFEILGLPLDQTERIIYSLTEPNFEIAGFNWLTREIDPNFNITKRKKEIESILNYLEV
jgi:hypothetical protein